MLKVNLTKKQLLKKQRQAKKVRTPELLQQMIPTALKMIRMIIIRIVIRIIRRIIIRIVR